MNETFEWNKDTIRRKTAEAIALLRTAMQTEEDGTIGTHAHSTEDIIAISRGIGLQFEKHHTDANFDPVAILIAEHDSRLRYDAKEQTEASMAIEAIANTFGLVTQYREAFKQWKQANEPDEQQQKGTYRG